MEIEARLHHVQLLSENPAECAAFYAKVYDMVRILVGDEWLCIGPERRVSFRSGATNQLGYAAYAFDSKAAFRDYRARVQKVLAIEPAETMHFGEEAFKVRDPDNNALVFGVAVPQVEQDTKTSAPPARLQHFAIRSPDPSALVPFYRDGLQFTISDRVFTEAGDMRACFMRTDSEHHALALFHSPEARHDHLSFETTDVSRLRDWADRMGHFREKIVWGVGRHGPGNDVFFMIRDPDGNLSEISAEMEICETGRTEGTWAHEERTLNLWGAAIMRS